MSQDVASANLAGNVAGNVLGNAYGNAPSASSGLIFSLPLNDLGAGAVNTTPAIARGSAVATFTRATTAWTKLASGLWASVASGTARSAYLGSDTTASSYGGYLAEGARTIASLYNRDLGNLAAAWTFSNVTPSLDAAGIDGVASDCTTLTATGNNGTALQSITSGSAARTFAPFVKRKTGTGTISITVDNGATWVDVTSQISSGVFTRVSVTQTLANPTIGFKFATSGDAIIVDMATQEVGAFASSPVPTTTASVTRNADVLTFDQASNIIGTSGSIYAEIDGPNASAVGRIVGIDSVNTLFSATFATFGSANGGTIGIQDGTNTATANFTPADQVWKVAASWGGSAMQAFVAGTAGSAGSFDGNVLAQTTFAVGNRTNGAAALFGTVKNLRIYNRVLSAAQLQAMTT